MPANDLILLQEAALEAGKIAMQFYGQSPEVWDKGGDAGPVSEADLAIDKMLQAEFYSARPDYGILSEEMDDDPIRLKKDRIFIIDPIDGTRSFLNKHENFATSVAIAERGEIIAGVVHLPAKGLTFTAAKDGGAFLDGNPIKGSERSEIKGARFLASGSQTRSDLWRDGPPPIERHFRSSLAYRLCLVAQGRFDGMLTLRNTWEWDVAAGHLICEEAGVKVTTQRGGGVRYNHASAFMDGMIACNKNLHDAVTSYL